VFDHSRQAPTAIGADDDFFRQAWELFYFSRSLCFSSFLLQVPEIFRQIARR
jgi:hypothetical protein